MGGSLLLIIQNEIWIQSDRVMILERVSRSDTGLVREKAYEYVKKAILSGQYEPGTRLAEEHLARDLGVSRTPVRECLHRLESEGFIKALETRGFIVSGDSREDVEELFELREILEGYALKSVCEEISGEELEELNSFISKAEDALQNNRVEEVFAWNTKFHDKLHALIAGRKRLRGLIVDLRKYVLRYRKDSLRYPDGGKRAITGHRKIVLALSLKDPALCEFVMREHIREGKEDALQVFVQKDLK